MEQKIIYISVPMQDREPAAIDADVQKAMEQLNERCAGKYEPIFKDPREIAKSWDALADFHDCLMAEQGLLDDKVPREYGNYLGWDIAVLLVTADVVAFCRGWRDSKGCRLERTAAEIYDKEIWEI
jgi:hypothetical protein